MKETESKKRDVSVLSSAYHQFLRDTIAELKENGLSGKDALVQAREKFHTQFQTSTSQTMTSQTMFKINKNINTIQHPFHLPHTAS